MQLTHWYVVFHIQVEVLQDQFRRFLQANNLEQDLARLSTAMDKQGQTLEEHTKVYMLQATAEIRHFWKYLKLKLYVL